MDAADRTVSEYMLETLHYLIYHFLPHRSDDYIRVRPDP